MSDTLSKQLSDFSLSPSSKQHTSTVVIPSGSRIVKDYLGFKTQPKIMTLFSGGKTYYIQDLETLLFSDKVKKINMFNWVQERCLVVTNEKIYNLKKNKIKRAILV